MGFVRSITFDAYRQVLKLVRFPRDHKTSKPWSVSYWINHGKIEKTLKILAILSKHPHSFVLAFVISDPQSFFRLFMSVVST
ncbi:hypothetical protein OIU74_020981, partial [Salix koriyanagi]